MDLELVVGAKLVKGVMRRARRISRAIDRGFEPLRAGWTVDAYDPQALLEPFPRLRLREGFRLSSYHFCDGANGNGFVFAIPAERRLPEPPEEGFDFERDPLPEWASADIGRFLEGDGSPLSCFQASIFIRELGEMGTLRQGCTWSTQEVITDGREIAGQEWEWQEEEPLEWLPTVWRDGGGPRFVVFYTYTGLGRERILRHTDVYATGYRFEQNPREIALGEGGYLL